MIIERIKELKPCPFCGSKNIKIYKSGMLAAHSITCEDCHAMFQDEYERTPGGKWVYRKSLKDLVKLWNTRPVEEYYEQQIKRAREYKGIEAWACPLCVYKNGKFIKSCNMHKQIDSLTKRNLITIEIK